MSRDQDQFLNVLDRDTAEAKWWAAVQPGPLGTEIVTLSHALGRILGANIVSSVDLPGFDRSNVDGYALQAQDTFGASEDAPLRLVLNQEELAPGVIPSLSVEHGTATFIATGAMIPRGADAVLMIEDSLSDDTGIAVTHPVAPGSNVSRAGSDISRGELILRRGMKLTSRETGTLAAIGLEQVEVFRRPRVAIISTGNEIVAPGLPLALGSIHDANATLIADAVRELGAEPIALGIVKDDLIELNHRLEQALTCADFVILSGGTSKGTGDLSYRILSNLTPGIIVHGVALKPGKPICLGVSGRTPIAVLPGFPTSAIFTFHELVAPVIRRLGGQGTETASLIKARLPHDIQSEIGRTEAVFVNLVDGPSGLVAYPLGKSSGSITTFTRADGYIVIPRERERLDAGLETDVVLLSEGTKPVDLVAIGSHCVGLDMLLSLLADEGFTSKAIWVGSQGGVTAVSRSECDLAGIHLLDPVTSSYNDTYKPGSADLVTGYGRMQGIVHRPDDSRFKGKSIDLAIESAISDPSSILINRNRGSGTRIVLDELLNGLRPRGYTSEVKSHHAVAAAVVQGRADWGLAIAPVAAQTELSFIPIREERYDFLIPRERRDRPAVRRFCSLLELSSTRAMLAKLGFDAHRENSSLGAIVLCGGQSRRMGRPKAWLPFGPEFLLQRVVRRVGSLAGTVIVVAATGQELPPLPKYAKVVRDELQGKGPLSGIASGLAAIPTGIDWVFACATDVPFVEPLWISRLLELSPGFEFVLPEIGGYQHPLAALYRREKALEAAKKLLQADRLRPVYLQEFLQTRLVGAEVMQAIDPLSNTLRNVNNPEDYVQSLKDAGFRNLDRDY